MFFLLVKQVFIVDKGFFCGIIGRKCAGGSAGKEDTDGRGKDSFGKTGL
jgi:hypothetical protein